MDMLTELTDKDIEDVTGAALTLSCCSFDIGMMTLSWDAFNIEIGGAFNADYGMVRSSAYNRL
ncbi:hypothetical protein [Alteromonas halophila]|uniref:Uncharacterized protein n=1 Tax=Alteromonas halophila TaxID=516698 RepID=A0A918JHN2_9ALTE|nr:hypothetical protein [Alteromonas halophila]GGW77745.1 hypothetical protein GCM10007391_07870 [Alteromonas halophila]